MSDSESTCLGKRQRVETDHGTPPRRGIKQKPGEDWVDDEDFYFQEGDVTILSERTRFRLSRFVLKRGSPLIERLLESPSPVQFTTMETAEDIRALSWATHGFPLPEEAQIKRLIAVLYICHKFQFFPHAEWAKQAIFKSTFPPSSEVSEPDEALTNTLLDASEFDLAKLLAALAPCSIPECPICKTSAETHVPAVCAVWLSFLQTNPSIPSRPAMDCAQTLGLRPFLGRLYYTQLVVTNARATVRYDTPETTAFEDRALDLSTEQTAALYRGYWSLSQFWNSVRYPPEVNTPDQASHDQECSSAWEQMWYEGVHGDGKSPYQWNPIGALLRLSQMETPAESDLFAINKDEAARCGCFFQKEARQMRRQLLDTLADHFLREGVPSKAQAPPEVGMIKEPGTPTVCLPSASVRDQEPPQHNSAQANATQNAQNVKPKQHQGQTKKNSKKQKKREAKAAKKKARVNQTTAILERGWELQHSSRSSSSSSTALLGRIAEASTVDALAALRTTEPPTPVRDPAEHQPAEARQPSAAAEASSAPEPSEHVPPQVNEPIVIEAPPPPPLDCATSPECWDESEGEQPSQNSYLFFRGGAEPAKIPKIMFNQHGKPLRNYVHMGNEDAGMMA